MAFRWSFASETTRSMRKGVIIVDEITRQQMNAIGNLINKALRNMAEAEFGPRCEKLVEKTRDEVKDNIVPFPINKRAHD